MSSKVMKSKCDLPKSFRRSNFSSGRRRDKLSRQRRPAHFFPAGPAADPLYSPDLALANLVQLSALVRAAGFYLPASLQPGGGGVAVVSTQNAATQTNVDISSCGAANGATASAAAGGRERKRRRRRDGSSASRGPKKRRKKEKRKRGGKSKRRRRESSRHRRRRKSCSSPTYSDYEPDNPFLRLRNK